MQPDEIINLAQSDWTPHNQQVLRYCKIEAEKFVAHRMEDYPPTHHFASVRGNMLWDQIDRFLELASMDRLFHGITHQLIKYRGAEILTLRGSRTCLTAKHVLSRDEILNDAEDSYRTNTRIRNQRNMELFKEYDTDPENEPLHIVFQHGGREGLFAYLKAYFAGEHPLALSDDIMLLPEFEVAHDSEPVPPPAVTLKTPGSQMSTKAGEGEREMVHQKDDDDGQS